MDTTRSFIEDIIFTSDPDENSETYSVFQVRQSFKQYILEPRTALGPTQPFIQWVPGILSLGLKRTVCEADHSPPSSAAVKNAWNCTYTPQ
jgi:hypothetical protein